MSFSCFCVALNVVLWHRISPFDLTVTFELSAERSLLQPIPCILIVAVSIYGHFVIRLIEKCQIASKPRRPLPFLQVLNLFFIQEFTHMEGTGWYSISWCTYVFFSNLYTGCMSDVEIAKLSGMLDLPDQGDFIKADKGFVVNKVLEGTGISINTPPFSSESGAIYSARGLGDSSFS